VSCLLPLPEVAVIEVEWKRKMEPGGETLAEHSIHIQAKEEKKASQPTCAELGLSVFLSSDSGDGVEGGTLSGVVSACSPFDGSEEGDYPEAVLLVHWVFFTPHSFCPLASILVPCFLLSNFPAFVNMHLSCKSVKDAATTVKGSLRVPLALELRQ
jgi:hypothetical protein